MNWLAIALIAFIMLWAYERNRNKRLRYENTHLIEQLERSERGGHEVPDQEDSDAIDARELSDLRERVQVLERIATDENSSEARKAQRIAREIESLRGDIAKRASETTSKSKTSEKTEDLSE